jgi:nicotinamidase-related amidase
MIKKLILVIDIQNEYISEGRPFHIKEIADSLNTAKQLIQSARDKNIPLWHIAHKQEGKVFSKESELSGFIAGFEPQKEELVFIKDLYSCFSSKEFAEKVTTVQPEEIIIIGYGSSMCCLCTIIDGIHRGFNFTLVSDATASKACEDRSEKEMHQSAINILTQYAKIASAAEVIHEF